MIHFVDTGQGAKTIVVVHGLGEHIGRYERFFDEALKRGYRVIGFDLPGHGKSSGIRGHAPLKKVLAILDGIVRGLEESPVIFGHSLGGLVAARYLERGGRARALILSSPGLSYDKKSVPDFLVSLAKVLSAIVPFLPMSNRIDPNLLSRNRDAVERYVSDPLVHDRISVKLARDFFVESVEAIRQAHTITVPTLITIGTSDEITPPSGAREFYENLGSRIKRLLEYEGAYHEIFEDPEYSDRFYEDIFDFLEDLEVLR